MKRIGTTALIGMGAIGCFVASKLHRAMGDNFYVIADGERKQRLERDGVVVNGTPYHFAVKGSDQADSPADLILITVKWDALDQALAAIKNHVGPNTVIMPLLNGVDSERRCADIYGAERVLYSIIRIFSKREGNQVTYNPKISFIEFGERENKTLTSRVQAVADLFDAAELQYKIPEDMILSLWRKFLGNIGDNLTCALIGAPYIALQTSEHARAIRLAAMQEVIAVANCLGIALGQEDIDRQDEVVGKMEPSSQPSTLQDILAGRKTEISMFSGELIRMGRECGVPVPCNEFLLHTIRALEEKNDGKFNV